MPENRLFCRLFVRQKFSAILALLGFAALASGISFAAHVRQEICHEHDHSTSETPHSPSECPVCQGLTASSTALVGGMIVVVAPVEATAARSLGSVAVPLSRLIESPASPRAPPTI